VSTSNWSMCQFVKSTNGQLTDGLTLSVKINSVLLSFFFLLTCPHKREEKGFELKTFASLGIVIAD
jgi:hypothetical protein